MGCKSGWWCLIVLGLWDEFLGGRMVPRWEVFVWEVLGWGAVGCG